MSLAAHPDQRIGRQRVLRRLVANIVIEDFGITGFIRHGSSAKPS